MIKQIVLCGALVVGGGAIAMYGEDTLNPSASQGAALSHRDITFIQTANEAGNAEILDAQLAIAKAANAEVKDFAQTMKADHAKVNKEIAGLAKSKSVEISAEAIGKHGNSYDKLTALNGAEFDKTYIGNQVTAHEEAVKLFKNEADKGDDSDIKAFALSKLPTLQHHLQMARDVQSKLGSTEDTK